MRRPRLRNAPGIFLVVALIGLTGYILGWSKALEIRSLEISAAGNEALIAPILIPKDVHIGLPMARVSNARITHDLAKFTWISEIKVRRRWFAHDLKVIISERRAIAQYQDNHGVMQYFDATGINFITPNPPIGIPNINFAVENDSARSSVATFLAQTPPEFTAKMSALTVDSQNQISLITSLTGHSNLNIDWGAANQIELKVQVLRRLLNLPENKKIVNVDLSNPLDPVVK